MNDRLNLSHANTGRNLSADWLREGILRMSGVAVGPAPAAEPFAPIWPDVGKSRELDWVTDLADHARTLHGAEELAFAQAMQGALRDLSRSLTNANWTAVSNLIELGAQVGDDRLRLGIGPLVSELQSASGALDATRRMELASSALMLLAEASSRATRERTRPEAIRLAKIIYQTDPPKTESESWAFERLLERRLGLTEEQTQEVLGRPLVHQDLRPKLLGLMSWLHPWRA